MPELDNEKHEMFAHFVARGNYPLASAIAAGYPPDKEMAEALARQPRIFERIEELVGEFFPFYKGRMGVWWRKQGAERIGNGRPRKRKT